MLNTNILKYVLKSLSSKIKINQIFFFIRYIILNYKKSYL